MTIMLMRTKITLIIALPLLRVIQLTSEKIIIILTIIDTIIFIIIIIIIIIFIIIIYEQGKV